MGSAWAHLACWWGWIGGNHDQLTVLITLGAVLVALWYAFLTRRLARTAADQAEAAHRPYLEIRSTHTTVEAAEGKGLDRKFEFGFLNHGSVPGVVVGWDLTIKRGDATIGEKHDGPDVMGVKSAVFPGVGDLVPALTELLHGLPKETIEVAARVTYTGLRGKTYWTRLRMLLIANPQAVRYFFVDAVVGGDA